MRGGDADNHRRGAYPETADPVDDPDSSGTEASPGPLLEVGQAGECHRTVGFVVERGNPASRPTIRPDSTDEEDDRTAGSILQGCGDLRQR